MDSIDPPSSFSLRFSTDYCNHPTTKVKQLLRDDLEPIDATPISPMSPSTATGHVNIHPLFNDANADLSLISSEGVTFRANSSSLTLASEWFRTMLSLPQNCSESKQNVIAEPIIMTETTDVLAALLSIVTWKPLPVLDSVEVVEGLLRAGEKYEMATISSIVRLAITAPYVLDKHPVRVYGIASSRGWTKEAKLASSKTICLDLLSKECLSDLATVESRDVSRLMLLHRRRRDEFREALEDPGVFSGNRGPSQCSHCRQNIIHTQWLWAKCTWWTMMEKSPKSIASKEFLLGKEAYEVTEAMCPNPGCRHRMYDREFTVKLLSDVVDRLPTTIEVSCVFELQFPWF